MPTCGGLRIGVLSSDPNTPPLVIVNVPPLRSASESVPSSARFANSRMPFSISAKRQPVGVAQHRHDQPLARADGDADVVVVLQHHLVALDLGVDPRERAQRADRRLDEERREAEADAVALLERLLVALAQRHHRGHVHLVEGGEHRRGALRLDEPPGDRGAALRHAHALFGAIAVWTRGDPRRRAAPASPSAAAAAGAGGAALAPVGRGGLLDVAPHDAAGVAAAAHAARDRRRFLRRLAAPSASRAALRVAPVGGPVGLLRSPAAAARPPAIGVAAPCADSSRIRQAPRRPSRPRRPCDRCGSSTPACGALTSRSILSVSSSTSGSPAATASPSFFSHLATRASTIDSPTSGTTIFDGICVLTYRGWRMHGRVLRTSPWLSAASTTALVRATGLPPNACAISICWLRVARGRAFGRARAARRARRGAPGGRPPLPAGAGG